MERSPVANAWISQSTLKGTQIFTLHSWRKYLQSDLPPWDRKHDFLRQYGSVAPRSQGGFGGGRLMGV